MHVSVCTLFHINTVYPYYILITTLLCLFANMHRAKIFSFITRFNPAVFRSVFPNSDITKEMQQDLNIHLCQSLLCSYHLLLPHFLPNLNTPSIFLHPPIGKAFRISPVIYYITSACSSGILTSFRPGKEVQG